MIKEDYVSFETAKLLKEKGFDEPTLYHCLYDNNVITHSKECKYFRNSELINAFDVPTLQTAMKWLREKHNIFIEISVDEELNEYGYQWALFDNTTKRIRPYAGWSDTYEQTCEKAIQYCLEILI